MSSLSATGYVHNMLDKKLNFEQFVWCCARAFGALVEMRDEPMNAPIPETLGRTSYHDERLEAAKAELPRLQAMSETERLEFGEARKAEAVTRLENTIAERDGDLASCRAMLVSVDAWVPPTPDHAGLKKFMREQLEISTAAGQSYYIQELVKCKAKEPLAYFNDAVASAERDIEYHTKHANEDRVRYAENNEWLRQLRESVPLNTEPVNA